MCVSTPSRLFVLCILLSLLVFACQLSSGLTGPPTTVVDTSTTATPTQTLPESAAAADSPTPEPGSGSEVEPTARPTETPASTTPEPSSGHVPLLVEPVDGANVTIPSLEWLPVEGAASYQVDISADETFNSVDHTFKTANSRLTPKRAIANGTLYWRVRQVTADGSMGESSQTWQFVKDIPPPQLVAPADGSTIILPVLEWEPSQGAVAYQVDLATDSTFNAVEYSYTTHSTRLTPKRDISNGTFFWRVRGVDAREHTGSYSAVWSLIKTIPAPELVEPVGGASVSIPEFEWKSATGAVAYRLEVAADPDFNQVDQEYTTFNTRLTPKKVLAPGLWHWRVQAVDSDHNGGDYSAAGSMRLESGQSAPRPLAPADGDAITTDPTYVWQAVSGANSYNLIVSTNPTFQPRYDLVQTEHTSYTPAGSSSDKHTYINETYYWKVEARDRGGQVISTSDAHHFTKQASLVLADPEDGANIVGAPTFNWDSVTGAVAYRVLVHTTPTFDERHDMVETEHTSYTPYGTGSDKHVYVNNTYFWMVEARSSSGAVICTSDARHLEVQTPVTLLSPDDGAGPDSFPTFVWDQVAGAQSYRLIVSTDNDFKSRFDAVTTDYTTYTPYGGGGDKPAYPAGIYYWMVQAVSPSGSVISVSDARHFTIG